MPAEHFERISRGLLEVPYREKRSAHREDQRFGKAYRKRYCEKENAGGQAERVSRLAMAEEYNCKPRELDEIITSEHLLLEKLRASGLSDEDLLKLVGGENAENEKSDTADLVADFGQQMSFTDKANLYED